MIGHLCFARRHSSTTRTLRGCAVAALSCLAFSESCFAINSSSRQQLGSTTSLKMSSTSTFCSSTFTVAQFPCLNDNYGYLIHDAETGQTAAIDTPCAKTYKQELQNRGWKLTHIFNTHHHWDHSGGNEELKKLGGVTIYGPVKEQEKIPGLDIAVGAGDVVEFGKSSSSTVMDVGGHTRGHIAYYFPNEQTVFVGDSLFALGCGRMFEGTPAQFWTSLKGLRELPDDTTVYCAHEYTESNAKFALSVEPGNEHLQKRAAEIMAKRARGEPTVPSKMGEEKLTNPFLRADVSEEIRTNVGVRPGDSDADAFGKVRRAKDTFQG